MFLGTLMVRKARGKKLNFMVTGGFDDLAHIQSAVIWGDNVKGMVFEFHGAEGSPESEFNPTDAAPFSLLRPF